jgi:hypothetical protein
VLGILLCVSASFMCGFLLCIYMLFFFWRHFERATFLGERKGKNLCFLSGRAKKTICFLASENFVCMRSRDRPLGMYATLLRSFLFLLVNSS